MICCGVPLPMIAEVNNKILYRAVLPKITDAKHRIFGSVTGSCLFPVPKLGFSSSSVLCRASEVAQLVQTTSPNIIVNEARLEDFWEVADIHCNVFFSDYSFPMDLLFRIDRLIGMLLGSSIPRGCNRTCLVAVAATPDAGIFYLGESGSKIGRLVGILTVDTVADFLPRKRRQRRAGIAYISNVAVREECRRKGIAKNSYRKRFVKLHLGDVVLLHYTVILTMKGPSNCIGVRGSNALEFLMERIGLSP